jgi:hypothetical protein
MHCAPCARRTSQNYACLQLDKLLQSSVVCCWALTAPLVSTADQFIDTAQLVGALQIGGSGVERPPPQKRPRYASIPDAYAAELMLDECASSTSGAMCVAMLVALIRTPFYKTKRSVF